MKLSEAMLKGCAISEWNGGSYISRNEEDKLCACAFGAAMLGAGGTSSTTHSLGDLSRDIGMIIESIGAIDTLPKPRGGSKLLMFQVTILSDNQILTREQIAEGLAKAGL